MKGRTMEILGTLTLVILVTSFLYWQVNPVGQAYNPDNLIRIHVIANSDSMPDQEIKDLVRLALKEEIQVLVAREGEDQAQQVRRAWAAIQNQVSSLERNVSRLLQEEGVSYPVRVETGVFAFPARYYEDAFVPQGRYRAVRVILGDGQGENWWCVLFPPLCLLDPASGYDSGAEALEPARQGLWADEEDLKEVPLEVRWVLLEMAHRIRDLGYPLRDHLAGLGRWLGAPELGSHRRRDPGH